MSKERSEAMSYLPKNIACVRFRQHKHEILYFHPIQNQNNQNMSFKQIILQTFFNKKIHNFSDFI